MHEAEVRHRRVGDQLLDVALGPGDERAVDDADDRQGPRSTDRQRLAASGKSGSAKRMKP